MKIIFKTQFGSHLYGTNTPSSDIDYKGVYLESLDDIILKRDLEVIHETTKEGGGRRRNLRNTKDDVETELKELRRFLFDCVTGQTYALDMIFAPYAIWEIESPEWIDIVTHREKLLSKNVQPYIS